MDINVIAEEIKAAITLAGKMTVQTAPDLSDAIKDLPATVNQIDIDLSDVTYVASAGLRVLVATEKLAVSRGGKMRLLHPCDEVMDVFEMTGLTTVFTIER